MRFAAVLPALLFLALPLHAGPWSGPYAAVLAGGAMGSGTVDMKYPIPASFVGTWMYAEDPAQINAIDATEVFAGAATGGVQAGYNWQWGDWVLGLEADFSSMPMTLAGAYGAPYDTGGGYVFLRSEFIRTDWLATLRPRVGYAVGPVLVQASAGLGAANRQLGGTWEDWNSGVPTLFDRSERTDVALGLAVGAGVEWRISPAYGLTLDYQFVKFGTTEFGDASGFDRASGDPQPDVFVFEYDLTVQTTRLGLNWHY